MTLTAPPPPRPTRPTARADWPPRYVSTLAVPVLVAVLGGGSCAGVYQTWATTSDTNARVQRIEENLDDNRKEDLEERALIKGDLGRHEKELREAQAKLREYRAEVESYRTTGGTDAAK